MADEYDNAFYDDELVRAPMGECDFIGIGTLSKIFLPMALIICIAGMVFRMFFAEDGFMDALKKSIRYILLSLCSFIAMIITLKIIKVKNGLIWGIMMPIFILLGTAYSVFSKGDGIFDQYL